MSALPTTPTTRAGKHPQRARFLIAGAPKSQKTRLLASWAPDTTLIVDTHKGSALLDGEHYIVPRDDAPPLDWTGFRKIVQDLILTRHHFQTVGLDLAEDLWRMCDIHHAPRARGGQLIAPTASAANDYQRSLKTAEADFKATVGRLLDSPLGVWFIAHTREKTEKTEGGQDVTVYAPQLEPRLYGWIQGACDFILLTENLGGGRCVIHTQPGVQFEAGCRVPLPEPLPLDARALWLAVDRGLNPDDYDADGKRRQPLADLQPIAQQPPPPPDPEPVREEGPAATGASDLGDAATNLWLAGAQARVKALGLKGSDLRGALTVIGAPPPERVASWERELAALDARRRTMLDAWLTAEEARRDPTPLDAGEATA